MIDKTMEWQKLNNLDQLAQIREESKQGAVLIFKHSTRCGTSRLVLDRLERNWNTAEAGHVKTYFLDLISFRDISSGIAEYFDVEHQSPQVLVISDGRAVYDRSHLGIDYRQILDVVKN